MIRKPTFLDLEGINEVLKMNGFLPMTENHLKDPCLIGVSDNEVRGIIWASVSESKELAFIDYFAIHPKSRGLGYLLIKEGLRRLKEMGVKKIMSVVRDAPERDKAFQINRLIGLEMNSGVYRVFFGETERMIK